MEILNQFGVNPVLLAAQVVNFLILLFILKKLLFKPVLKVLEERKQRIADSLKNAEKIELQLQKTQEKSEEIISDTLKESEKIMAQTKEAAAQVLQDANKHAEEILIKASEDGKELMRMQQDVLMGEMKKSAGRLVAVAFEKIVGEKPSERQRKIIEKEVKNLS